MTKSGDVFFEKHREDGQREWAEASEGAFEWGRFFCFSRYAVKQKNRPRDSRGETEEPSP